MIFLLFCRQQREKIVIASKARYQTKLDDMNYVGLSRRHLIEACEDSLRRLQTDLIDLYQVSVVMVVSEDFRLTA